MRIEPMQGKLGHYNLIAPLHGHDRGVTRPQLYLAQSIHDQEFLVIKLLSVNASTVEQQLFLNEMRVLRQLNGFNTGYWLPCYESGQDLLIDKLSSLEPDLVYYFTAPYMVHGSVKQALNRQPGTLQQAEPLWLSMLEAVTCLHQHHWLHLDIKPSNFLLKTPERVCLIDFALAQPINHTIQQGHVARTQGTPRYMSPEQFLGQPSNRQTDFYSLGLILYEILTGKSLFSASSYHGWAIQHCQKPVALLPECVRSFQPLMDGLLAKNRNTRLSEPDEIRSMFQHAVDGIRHQL